MKVSTMQIKKQEGSAFSMEAQQALQTWPGGDRCMGVRNTTQLKWNKIKKGGFRDETGGTHSTEAISH